MFARIKAWLFGSSRDLAHAASVKRAETVRQEALKRVRDAKRRGDTRDLNAAWRELTTATHEALKLELGR